MSRRAIWEEFYKRFDPFSPPVKRAWRADRDRSPAGDIVALLHAPFDGTRVIVTGTTGTGKSTELRRVAEECTADHFVVLLDLQRHFNEVVGDEQALINVSSWEVVFLAGLSVLRAATEFLPYPIPPALVENLTKAWNRIAKAPGSTPAPAQIDVGAVAKSMIVFASGAAPHAGIAAGVGLKILQAAAGAVKWPLTIGRLQRPLPDLDADVQSLLGAVNSIIGHIQQKMSPVLLVIDGLDRILSFDRAEALFLRSELIAQLACHAVVTGPFALHTHPAKGSIPRFSKNCVLYNEPVLRKGKESEWGSGVPFFCELFRLRTEDLKVEDIISDEMLQRLAYYSGGRARDFVKLIRSLAERGWIEDAGSATAPLVDKVIDEARRLLEAGLDAGHIKVLQDVTEDPGRRLPADALARDLLDYGKLLPYPNESEWYYPHPLLTMHLVGATPTGSHG
jgi:hypothetical protein